MEWTSLSSVFTVLSLLTFLGIIGWAFSRHNKQRFEQMAHAALEDDDAQDAGIVRKGNKHG